MHSALPLPAIRPRAGVTLLELIVVITIAGILMGLAMPRLAPLRQKSNVRSAKQLLTAYLTTARSIAVQRGDTATFRINGNRVWVTANSDTISPPADLNSLYGVTLTAGVTTFEYTARGYTRPAASQILRVVRGTNRDSVCLSSLGMVGRCGL